MGKVSPYKNSSTISSTHEGIEIVIPSQKNWFIIAFMFAWLGGWFFGEKSAIEQLLNGKDQEQGFLLFWLLGWTVGGVFALLVWLWNIAGKEIIRIGSGALIYSRAIGNFKITKEYDLAHIKDMKVSPVQTGFMGQHNGLDALGVMGGPISFDYGAKTIRIGSGIDEAEAKKIVEEIKSNYKNI